MYLAVIPAKGRSQRFPGKNAAFLAGTPLVVHAVNVAREADIFRTVMVSTDDPTIGELARDAGAEVPFEREAALTADTVEVPAVTRHAIEWYRQREQHFDWVCILQPTSPLRQVRDLLATARLIESQEALDAVVSVTPYRHHPHWALRIQDGRVVPEHATTATASRQHLPELYHPDGTVIWWRCDALARSLNIYDGHVAPYHTPPDSVLDIDYPDELAWAEYRSRNRP